MTVPKLSNSGDANSTVKESSTSEKCPSDEALAQVGKPTRYVVTAPKRSQKTVEGVCIGVRASGSVMVTDEGEFPGVQFQIEEPNGTRSWTRTMADKGASRRPDTFDPQDVPAEDRYGR